MNSIVIGSGFGGMAAALRLKAKGHNVTLIEKHEDLGGRARVFKKNGFTFDGGPTVITAPYLIDELFQLFNKNSKDYLEIKSLKTWYQFVFEDGFKFDYSGDEEEMIDQIKKNLEKLLLLSPESYLYRNHIDRYHLFLSLLNFLYIDLKGYLQLSFFQTLIHQQMQFFLLH